MEVTQLTSARAVKAADEAVALPQGFRAAGVHCGIKTRKSDLALVVSDVPASAAGVFTQIKGRAACVIINERKLRSGRAQAVIVNSGNANACTGARGFVDADAMAAAAAAALGFPEGLVLAMSTGVIGRPLPVERITKAAPGLVSALGRDCVPAARAMMTTDAFPKCAIAELPLGDGSVRIVGIAKGAGMIHPNMATMIAVITTDASIEASALRQALRSAVDVSFNCISVDGDTSTSDGVFVLANGASACRPISYPGERYDQFAAALTDVARRLAHMIVEDGEGNERIVEVVVRGARSDSEARMLGQAVMTSVLVKTAFHGAELNWGRIVAAAGRSGAELELDRLSIAVGGVEIVRDGVGVEEAYERAQPFLEQPEVQVTIGLELGDGTFTGWTSDLSPKYVRFNSGYLT
ncbi:MAG: bifunctional glutamate N-acetyltransferase/amino-acid acetyltransferase ArgJ [Gaiellaceae bacterium]